MISTTEMGTIAIPTMAGTTPPRNADHGNSIRVGVTKAVKPATSNRLGASSRARTNIPNGRTTAAKTNVNAISTLPASAATSREVRAAEA